MRRKQAVVVGVPRHDGASVEAEITGAGGARRLRYAAAGGVAPHADPFLVACLLPAMRLGAPLRVEAPVSARLLGALDAIQDVFARWSFRFQRVHVDAEPRRAQGEPFGSERAAAAFFSCGLDSFYTLHRHAEELDALLFVRGHDPLLDTSGDADLAEHVRTVARELGKGLVEIEAPVRTVWDDVIPWEWYHGTALASVGLALAPQVRMIFVPPSQRLDDLFPWGSHPDVDPRWSTEAVEIRYEDAASTRFERTEVVAESDLALRHLQVCWARTNDLYNCCRCEKCLRTMAALEAVGALDRAKSFALPLEPALVAELELLSPAVRRMHGDVLASLERSGRNPELEAAERRALRPFRVKRFRRKLGRWYRGTPTG